MRGSGRGARQSETAATPHLTRPEALYGWLTKQPENIGRSHRRFFIFVPKVFKIMYYKSEEDAAAREELLGEIEVTGGSTVAVDGKRLTIGNEERLFKLDADSTSDALRWGNQLSQFIRAARGLQQKIANA